MSSGIPSSERDALNLALASACRLAEEGCPGLGYQFLCLARSRVRMLPADPGSWVRALRAEYEVVLARFAARYPGAVPE